MFQLGGSNFPKTREELVAAVTEGVRAILTLPPTKAVVTIEPSTGTSTGAGSDPNFARVSIDLTAARFMGDRLPPEPKGTGKTQPAGIATRFEIAGHPLYVRDAAVDLALTAGDARFNYDRDAAGRPILVLADAKNGTVAVRIRKNDLDALVLTAAREGAKQQGVQILEAQLALTQVNDRSVSADVRVKAKKMFMTATLNLRGKLAIDDALNARISGLSVSGEGVLGEMASAGIRPHVQALDGRTFPLTALPLGDVRIRDVRVQVGDTLIVTANFGS
ncbi:MAG TPA: hypothetical protein VFE47_16495 [Tepidisphaeraceae bacterium]|jgi:hypothetical protein|nr:hypothetical protein [Tepidisphaeraceae bacterium]